jgi:hypothetical protein
MQAKINGKPLKRICYNVNNAMRLKKQSCLVSWQKKQQQ